MAVRYPIGDSLSQMSTLLDISPERVLRRVGLSDTLAGDKEISVGPETFFRLWDAACAEANRPGVEMDLAMAYAHGPFIPPIFAFSCADTLALGLQRLSDFKPLVGPVEMDVTRPNDNLHVIMRPSVAELTMPASMGLFELFYITECARTFTGKHVSPISTSLPTKIALDEAGVAYLGAAPKTAGDVSITFSAADAALPLITRSTSLWETLEPGFIAQLKEQSGTATMSGRIRHALAEALPGGSSSIEDMARRLNVSKRSLQRRLKEEGTSYQELLGDARLEVSRRYLRTSGLSVPEISYLLGFRETSSFFRAFHGWTGMTPGDYRTTRWGHCKELLGAKRVLHAHVVCITKGETQSRTQLRQPRAGLRRTLGRRSVFGRQMGSQVYRPLPPSAGSSHCSFKRVAFALTAASMSPLSKVGARAVARLPAPSASRRSGRTSPADETAPQFSPPPKNGCAPRGKLPYLQSIWHRRPAKCVPQDRDAERPATVGTDLMLQAPL